MNKRSKVTIITPFGKAENIDIEEIVKQGTTYGSVMCFAITASVNNIGDKFVVSLET